MRVECIAVGTELLVAGRLDMNSIWLADRLSQLGLTLHRKTVVGDVFRDQQNLFLEAIQRSDLVICTGGLGPTFDDLTKEAWASVMHVDLREDALARQDILDFYSARQRVPPESNFKQALIPMGARMLRNRAGTAPGIYWEGPPGFPGRRIVLLPGVPQEMKCLWEEQVEPLLMPLATGAVHTLRLVVGAVGESALDEQTRPLRVRHDTLEWTILAGLGQVELIAKGQDPAALEAAQRDFQEALGLDLVCVGAGSLDTTVLELLRARGESLVLAESVTGGQIAARLAAIPGASEVFLGDAVVYSPIAKTAWANVSPDILRAHGTVAEATTRAMAEGVRARLGATWALATTGNAGPTADTHGSAPVGLLHVAIAGPSGTESRQLALQGSRRDIQQRAAALALDLLRRRLVG